MTSGARARSSSRARRLATLAARFGIFVVVTASAARTASAREESVAAPLRQRILVGAGLGTTYDSNILEYSKDQIALFEGGTRPDRYSIETTDDLVWSPSLALSWEMLGAQGRRHALRLRGEGAFHQKNATADFHSISAGWRESWSRDRRLSASWYVLPDFYLRQLFDEDAVTPFPGMSHYRRAHFRLDIGAVDWTQRIGRSNSFGLGGQFERRRYRADFRERDSGTWQGEISWGWVRLPRRARVEVRGLFRVSDARGDDGDEIAGLAPDDVDIGYHGPGGGLHTECDLVHGFGWRVIGDADYQLAARDFDSDRPADRYHFGRHDVLNSLELGTALRLRGGWRARGFWHFDRNFSKLGAAAPPTSDAGEYSRSQAGLELGWSGTLRKSRAGSEGDE